MDTDFYSDAVVSAFVKSALCQGDAKLVKWFREGNVRRFRERLVRKFPEADLQPVVYACVTDVIRDLVLDTIGSLTVSMRSAGDLIVSGGEAFNMYFEQRDRIITSDIDTKFVPVVKGFEALQAIKLKLWHLLGQHAKRLSPVIRRRIQTQLRSTRVGKFLGISLAPKGPLVTRRFTLIPKKRQSLASTAVRAEDVLIDVELFALDLRLRYFVPEKKRVTPVNLGGILDIAMMRPGEMGYEVALGRNQGVRYVNRSTKKMRTDRRILFASRRFLIEDLYLMNELKLRPNKKAKDRLRMFQFATAVLGVKVAKSDAIGTIFKKCEAKLGAPPARRAHVAKRGAFVARSFDPGRYAKWTTKPEKLQQAVSASFAIPGFARTSGPYRFDTVKKRWTANTSPEYIKNEMAFRAESGTVKKLPKGLRLMNTLYGYRANRNGASRILVNSARIPFIGLKNGPTL